MVQKLSKTLYQKILLEHRRYARIKGLQLPEEKDLLHQQIVHSPDLNRYINRGKLETGGNVRARKSRVSHLLRNLTLTTNIVGLFEIIAWPALTQSAKGIITAGPTRTARYAGEKLKKWWQAKK
jgi:translocator assembly and maintenance protein 41